VSESPHAGEASASPGPPQPRRSSGSGWHSAGWWAGAGGLATVLAALVAIAAWWFPRSPNEPAAPASPTASAPIATSGITSTTASTSSTQEPPPLAVSLLEHGGSCGFAQVFYLPQDVDEVSAQMPQPPPDFEYSDVNYEAYLDTLDAWVRKVGGWPATNAIRISVEGGSGRATILTGLRVNLVRRNELPSKTVITFAECGGGLLPPHPFSIDFNATPPSIQALPGETENADGTTSPAKAVDFPFKVSETDPEVFDLDVEAGPVCDCLWTVTLSYTQGGKSYTVVIDDNGEPFHAVPADNVATYHLVDGVLEPVS
jgi:hypothetical protein